jgi:hypothetical protein
MAWNQRGRTLSNDNLAGGAASGRERTISGALPPAEKVGGKDNVAVGVPFPTTVCPDNIVTPGVTTLLVERRTP